MILIDSNVVIDILNRDPAWFDWSMVRLERAAAAGPLAINPVVVAEAAPRFGNLEAFITTMKDLGIDHLPLDADAAFHAGAAFQRYRQARPTTASKAILADFLIAGHAQALNATVLTRDPRFYSSYFPDLTLITPETDA